MRNTRTLTAPLSVEEGTNVHRREMTLINAVCEQGNFTRYITGKSKPEVSQ